ncbi:hypothetical protein BDW66DRAFT_166480 [Aspergillus desertorum]
MDRQVSYNSPLSSSSLPSTFTASRPSILMNPQHIKNGNPFPGKPIPTSIDRERPSTHRHATTSSIGMLSGPHTESAICPSSEDTITRPENSHDKASHNDNFEPPHPENILRDMEQQRESCVGGTSSTISKIRGTGVLHEGHIGDTENGRQNKIGPAKDLADESKGGLSNILELKGQVASCCLVEELHTTFCGCSSPQPVTKTTVCSPSRIFQSKHYSRKRPAYTISGYVQIAADGGPLTRARARARAEASCSPPSRKRARPYSDAEDKLLRELMHRRLQWEQIEEEFGRKFAGRDLKSLQGRWSRKLKFEAQPAACSKPKGK